MKNRLVCECYNIYVEDIKNEVLKGARTFEDLVKINRIGVMCSACINKKKRVLEEIKTELGVD